MQENQIIKSTKDKKTKHSILSPKLDVVFQILFGEVGSEEITKDLLSAILDEQINTIDLNQNIVLRRKNPKDKMGIVDVLAKINDNEYCNIEMQVSDDNEYCNIEMQVSDDKDIIKRILYYWSKQYSKELQKGHPYIDLKRTINVLIANFKIDILKNLEFHTQWKIIEENGRKTVLTDDLELHIIELPKMRNNKATGKDKKLIEWLSFLNNPESKEVTNYMKNNESMKKAKEKLNTMSEDERIRRLAELREKAILDELEVKAYNYRKGKNEGLEQKNKEIAKKLKEKGLNIDFIIEITNLTKEEIEKL